MQKLLLFFFRILPIQIPIRWLLYKISDTSHYYLHVCMHIFHCVSLCTRSVHYLWNTVIFLKLRLNFLVKRIRNSSKSYLFFWKRLNLFWPRSRQNSGQTFYFGQLITQWLGMFFPIDKVYDTVQKHLSWTYKTYKIPSLKKPI